jgi:iron-sulfur cluster insertion protein
MGSKLQMITITDSAVGRVKEIISEENNSKIKLRVGVQGGGCSGMQYFFTLDEVQSEDDFLLNISDVSILVDSISSQYLAGAVIDYVENIYGSNFSIENPNAQTSCGCGSSFGVGDSFYDDMYSHDHHDFDDGQS